MFDRQKTIVVSLGLGFPICGQDKETASTELFFEKSLGFDRAIGVNHPE